MRCSCQNCGTYMIQADDLTLGCVCPDCFARCTACLGTNTVLSPDQIRRLHPDMAPKTNSPENSETPQE